MSASAATVAGLARDHRLHTKRLLHVVSQLKLARNDHLTASMRSSLRSRLHEEERWRQGLQLVDDDLHQKLNIVDAVNYAVSEWTVTKAASPQRYVSRRVDGRWSVVDTESGQPVARYSKDPGDEALAQADADRRNAAFQPPATPQPVSPNAQEVASRLTSQLNTASWVAQGVQMYLGMAAPTGQAAGQASLDHLGLHKTFEWAHPRNMAQDLYQVRGSKVIQAMHGSHVGQLSKLIVDATNPRTPKTIAQVMKEIDQRWPGMRRYQVERIARTETATLWTHTAVQAYAANGITEFESLVAQGPMIGIDSDLPCDECEAAASDGPWPIDESVDLPPWHPNCRCEAVPVLEGPDGEPWLPPDEPWAGGDMEVEPPSLGTVGQALPSISEPVSPAVNITNYDHGALTQEQWSQLLREVRDVKWPESGDMIALEAMEKVQPEITIGGVTRANDSGFSLLVARRPSGELTGIGTYSSVEQRFGAWAPREVWVGGNVAAVGGTGLDIFKDMIQRAASANVGLKFESTRFSLPLYRKLGIPEGASNAAGGMTHELSVEQVQKLSQSIRALRPHPLEPVPEPVPTPRVVTDPEEAQRYIENLRAQGGLDDPGRMYAASALGDVKNHQVRVIVDSSGNVRGAINWREFEYEGQSMLIVDSLGSTVKGGGTELLRQVARAAKESGRVVGLQGVKDAWGFYQKLGFEQHVFVDGKSAWLHVVPQGADETQLFRLQGEYLDRLAAQSGEAHAAVAGTGGVNLAFDGKEINLSDSNAVQELKYWVNREWPDQYADATRMLRNAVEHLDAVEQKGSVLVMGQGERLDAFAPVIRYESESVGNIRGPVTYVDGLMVQRGPGSHDVEMRFLSKVAGQAYRRGEALAIDDAKIPNTLRSFVTAHFHTDDITGISYLDREQLPQTFSLTPEERTGVGITADTSASARLPVEVQPTIPLAPGNAFVSPKYPELNELHELIQQSDNGFIRLREGTDSGWNGRPLKATVVWEDKDLGIIFKYESDAKFGDDENLLRVQRQLHNMTKDFYGIVPEAEPADLIQVLRGDSPDLAYWRKQKGWGSNSTIAAQASARGHITFWRGESNLNQETLDHEMGHVLGSVRNNGPHNDSEWIMAQTLDKRHADELGIKFNLGRDHGVMFGERAVTPYGATAIEEDWAESLMLYMRSKRTGTIFPYGIRGLTYTGQEKFPFEEAFPNRTKLLEKWIRGIETQPEFKPVGWMSGQELEAERKALQDKINELGNALGSGERGKATEAELKRLQDRVKEIEKQQKLHLEIFGPEKPPPPPPPPPGEIPEHVRQLIPEGYTAEIPSHGRNISLKVDGKIRVKFFTGGGNVRLELPRTSWERLNERQRALFTTKNEKYYNFTISKDPLVAGRDENNIRSVLDTVRVEFSPRAAPSMTEGSALGVDQVHEGERVWIVAENGARHEGTVVRFEPDGWVINTPAGEFKRWEPDIGALDEQTTTVWKDELTGQETDQLIANLEDEYGGYTSGEIKDIRNAGESYARGLTNRQTAAIDDYVYGDAGYVDENALHLFHNYSGGETNGYNYAVRNAKRDDPTKVMNEVADELAGAIDAGPKLPEMTLLRAVSDHDFITAEGETFIDNGFMSTTASVHALDTVVSDFIAGNQITILEMDMPAGFKGLYLDPTNPNGAFGVVTDEILLQRGSRFEVTSISIDPSGARRVKLKYLGVK